MNKAKAWTAAFFIFAAVFYFFYSSHKSRPNVLIIHIDSLRPDHLGCYGYARNTSPHIDQMAGQGVVFSNAISQASHTLASNPSFITSNYPYRNIVDFKGHAAYINPEDISLPGVLKKYGYATALITDHPTYVGRILGLKPYFDSYGEIETNHPRDLTRSALAWLKVNKDKRFFLWLYYFGAHGPYDLSAPYGDIFFKDGLPKRHKQIPIAGDDGKQIFGVIPKHISESGITDVDHYVANYDGQIKNVDEQIGRILAGIKSLGLDQNTIIILTSDHGESMGEHNYYFRHGATLYDEMVKVPLIFMDPRHSLQKKRVGVQARLMDVVPTILDRLHINKPRSMKGSSLLPCISRGNCSVAPLAFCGTGASFFVRTLDWKLIYIDRQRIKASPRLSQKFGDYHRNDYELYDLKRDPQELNNVAAKERKVFEGMKKVLQVYVRKTREYQKYLLKKYPLKNDGSYISPDNALKDKLRSLGYL